MARYLLGLIGTTLLLFGAGGRLAAEERVERFEKDPGWEGRIVTTWIDGNAQVVYFDDLRYTCKTGVTSKAREAL